MPEPMRLAVPLLQPADVRPHLGMPTHWRQGRSAKSLADCWYAANDVPEAVRAVLETAPEYRGVELVDAWLERQTDLLDGRGSNSQTDLLALIGLESELAVLAIEAKVDEPFGPFVSDWLADGSAGKARRLAGLCALLGISQEKAQGLRYQLLHRTAAAIFEAKRFRLQRAVLIVQSFCPKASGLSDFADFVAAIGSGAVPHGAMSQPTRFGAIEMRFGWVCDKPPPGQDLPTVEWLSEFGRTRLSDTFFMRDFLFSDIAAVHGFSNIPANPELAVEAGKRLCTDLLEPLQQAFGRVAIRSAYRSPEVNGFGAKMQNRGAKGYSCASNERNAGAHIWDLRDAHGGMGATACVVVPSIYDRFGSEDGGWRRLAWWIHDHLPYSSMTFYPKLWAFNLRWCEEPERRITSYVKPLGTLTAPGMDNHAGSHRSEWEPLVSG